MMILGKFRQWLHDTLETRPQGRSVSRERRVQLRLEALEAREVPATFNVSTIDQLRAAIDKANSTAAADVINLKAGVVFDLNTTDAPKSPNLGNPLVIASGGGALTIRVASGANATLLQDGTDRVFIIEQGAKLSLSRVTITGGYADADSDFGAQGGGILSFGTLSVANSIIQNNYVLGDGCEGNSDAIGGGIASYGALTVTNSTIAYNEAEAGDNWDDDCIGYFAKGGGVAHFKGKLTITNTLFRDNLAQGGFSGAEGDAIGGFAAGGGLFAGPNDQASDIPSISITNSTFLRNQAIGGGAEGFDEYYSTARGGAAFGGGAALGGPYGSKYPPAPGQSTAAITITGTTFSQNLAQGGNAEFTGGEGNEAIGGDASGGGLFFSVQANVVLSKDNFIQNQAQGGQATVDDSFEGGNYARGGSAFGGGVAAGTRFDLPVDCCGYQTERLPFYGNLTITSSDFRSNTAQGGAAFGGAEGSTDGGDGYGGGLAQYGGRGLTQVTSSTFSGNKAEGGKGNRAAEFDFGYVDGGQASGGGIFFGQGQDRHKEDGPLVSRLNIKNSTLQSNQALGGDAILDGAEGNGGYAYAGRASGGGLAVNGQVGVTIANVLFNANKAQGGEADVSGGEGGQGGDAYGGAVSVGQASRFSGTLSITSSTFTANKANGGKATVNDPDGADDFDGLWAYGGNGVGGALALGGSGHNRSSTNFSVTLSTFTGNEANGGNAVIGGQGEAYAGDGIGGAVAHGGGSSGPRFAEVKGSSYFDSVLNVTTTTFKGNTARGGDAETRGSSNSCDDRAYGGDGIGGGLFTDPYVQTQVTRSTFDTNVAQGGDADNRGEADRVKGGHGLGGGLALGTNYGYSRYGFSGGEGGDYQLILANCTFAYNEALGGEADDADKKSRGGDGAGGGLFIQAGSYARLVNNTIAYNVAQGGEGDDCDGEGRGGGLYSGDECECGDKGPSLVYGVSYGYGIEMLNTLIALNLADCGNDVYGRVNSLGCNLIGDAEGSCGFDDCDPLFGDLLNVFDPKIGQLANNGGPTRTIALLKGSPAINRGNNSVLATSPFSIDKLTVDQRGHMRKAGPRVDIGAFEYGSPVLGRGQP
ncbi:MAG: hypothetical protein JNM56_12575 [Planctomycetia bacterium]|nr:hypothetical protein [Planctomycetia bacterium]